MSGPPCPDAHPGSVAPLCPRSRSAWVLVIPLDGCIRRDFSPDQPEIDSRPPDQQAHLNPAHLLKKTIAIETR